MRRGSCGIALIDGALQAVLVIHQGGRYIPCAQISINVSGDDFLKCLHHNIERLDEEIEAAEEAQGLVIEKIYCMLPFDRQRFKVVEDVFPLAKDRKKPVLARDIRNAKDHTEGVMLDWNERCIHNIVLQYYLDNQVFTTIPVNAEARKLKLKSLLVSAERKLFTEVRTLFENVDRQFQAFIWWPLAQLSIAAQENIPLPSAAVDIRNDATFCSVVSEEGIVFEKFDLSYRSLRRQIADKFSLSESLCADILKHYVSFQNTAARKEVMVKENQRYVSIDTPAISEYFQEILKNDLCEIVEFIKRYVKEDFSILFSGYCSCLQGFVTFVRGVFPHVTIHSCAHIAPEYAYLLGCAKYGNRRYLEEVPTPKVTFLTKLAHIYRDYF